LFEDNFLFDLGLMQVVIVRVQRKLTAYPLRAASAIEDKLRVRQAQEPRSLVKFEALYWCRVGFRWIQVRVTMCVSQLAAARAAGRGQY